MKFSRSKRVECIRSFCLFVGTTREHRPRLRTNKHTQKKPKIGEGGRVEGKFDPHVRVCVRSF